MKLNINKGHGISEWIPPVNEVLLYIKKILDAHAFEGKAPLKFKEAQDILDECGLKDDSGYIAATIKPKIPAMVNMIMDQVYLRVLRNSCLHWSANYAGWLSPFQPTESWVRDVY